MWRIRIRRAKLKGAKVQNGAELLCKSAKVSAAGGRERTEYGVQIAERGRSPREAARLARSANPTSLQGEGFREWGLGARG